MIISNIKHFDLTITSLHHIFTHESSHFIHKSITPFYYKMQVAKWQMPNSNIQNQPSYMRLQSTDYSATYMKM